MKAKLLISSLSLAILAACSGGGGEGDASTTEQPKPLPMEQPGNPVETGATKETLPELPLPKNGYGKFFFKKSKTSSRLYLLLKAGIKII